MLMEGAVVAEIGVSGRAPVSHFSLTSPDRVVVDIRGATQSLAPPLGPGEQVTITVGAGGVERVRVGQMPDRVRVVFDLIAARVYRVERLGGRLLVRFLPEEADRRREGPKGQSPQASRATVVAGPPAAILPPPGGPQVRYSAGPSTAGGMAQGIPQAVTGTGTGEPPAPVTTASAALRIPRAATPPKIEDYLGGRPTGAAAEVTGFRQREPRDGAPASRATTAYLSYDGENLYVAFVCKDDPSKVRARLAKREAVGGDDLVAVYLDTYRDRRRAYMFFTNPRGVQRDGVATEGQADDFSFDAVWHSEGRLTAEGYVVLIAVPFASLRHTDAKAQTWGVALARFIPRLNEGAFWPYITSRVEGFAQQFAALEGIESVSPERNWQVIPYGAFAGARYFDPLALDFRRSRAARYGYDAKLVLRDSFTLDLTLRPDFSEVETDEPQVTVNQRFSLLYPEKRPFFIENAGFFQTPETLFFSRAVVEPLVGARLTGKVGRWALGAIAIDDAGPGNRLPADDPRRGERAAIGVVRLQREFAEQSAVGLLATSRDLGPASNRVLAADARLKLSPNWVFSAQLSRSYDRAADGGRLSGPAYFAELSRSGLHLTYTGTYLDRSPDFRAALGFVPRVDVRQTSHTLDYRFRPGKGPVVEFGPSAAASINWDRGGRVQDWFVQAGFAAELKGQTLVDVSRLEAYEFFQGAGFRKSHTDVFLSTDWLSWLGVSVAYGTGGQINYFPAAPLAPFLADEVSASASLVFRPTPRLRAEQTYLYTRLRTGAGDVSPASIFTNHILRSKLNYQFTRRLSLRLIVDYNGVLPNAALIDLEREKTLAADLLLTYLIHPGTAFFVGYKRGYENFSLDPTDPVPLRRTARPGLATEQQIYLKAGYLLRF
jgi:hypothetical protein